MSRTSTRRRAAQKKGRVHTFSKPTPVDSTLLPEFTGTLSLEVLDTKILDEAAGVVESLVSVSGNVDDGGDRILPGAYEFERNPKIVWSHDLKELVGKVLEAEEMLPGNPALPDDLVSKGFGALRFVSQFDLSDPDGYRAFRKVKFHEDLGWSIGYRAVGAKRRKDGGRDLPKVVVYEASPVTFGMNVEARTLSVKGLLDDLTPEDREKAEKAVQLLLEDEGIPQEEEKMETEIETPEVGTDEAKVYPPLEGSIEERREKVSQAFRGWMVDNYGEPSPENPVYGWVEATFEDSVVGTVENEADQSRESFLLPYSVDADGMVSLGDATQVEIVTTVEFVPTTADADGMEALGLDEAIVEDVKAGRVLSKANRAKVKAALDALAAVIEAAGEEDSSKGADDPETTEVEVPEAKAWTADPEAFLAL